MKIIHTKIIFEYFDYKTTQIMVLAILCTALHDTTLAGERLNSLIFLDDNKCIIANRVMIYYIGLIIYFSTHDNHLFLT